MDFDKTKPNIKLWKEFFDKILLQKYKFNEIFRNKLVILLDIKFLKLLNSWFIN